MWVKTLQPTSYNPQTMNTQDFLNTLEQSPNKPLVFNYGSGTIRPGYHVTEVMNVTYETMDCGGQANVWRETVIQLMGPSIKDKPPYNQPQYMSIEKFLNIYKKVAASVPVRSDSEVRFEYGDTSLPAIHYHVGNIEERDDTMIIHFAQPGVTCKATDRNIDGVSCCTPMSDVINNVVWGDSISDHSKTSKEGCC
jgi:Family of unknown function (DUF6428)